MTGCVKAGEEEENGRSHLINQSITMVFEEQPLALPGSAKYKES